MNDSGRMSIPHLPLMSSEPITVEYRVYNGVVYVAPLGSHEADPVWVRLDDLPVSRPFRKEEDDEDKGRGR